MGYGPYYVRAIYSDCEEESNPLFGPQGLEDIMDENLIKIYPNPTRSSFNVSSSEEITRIRIISLYGEILFDMIYSENHVNIASDTWKSGFYIVEIYDTKKITKAKILLMD